MHSSQPTTNRYDPSTPRFALGLTAAAITAAILSMFVLIPASVDAETHDPAMVALSLRCTAGM